MLRARTHIISLPPLGLWMLYAANVLERERKHNVVSWETNWTTLDTEILCKYCWIVIKVEFKAICWNLSAFDVNKYVNKLILKSWSNFGNEQCNTWFCRQSFLILISDQVYPRRSHRHARKHLKDQPPAVLLCCANLLSSSKIFSGPTDPCNYEQKVLRKTTTKMLWR